MSQVSAATTLIYDPNEGTTEDESTQGTPMEQDPQLEQQQRQVNNELMISLIEVAQSQATGATPPATAAPPITATSQMMGSNDNLGVSDPLSTLASAAIAQEESTADEKRASLGALLDLPDVSVTLSASPGPQHPIQSTNLTIVAKSPAPGIARQRYKYLVNLLGHF